MRTSFCWNARYQQKTQGFIASSQGTVKGLNLEKLSNSAESLLTELRETIQKVQPGLANSISLRLRNARKRPTRRADAR